MKRRNAWKEYKKKDMAAVEELSVLYRRFLDAGKTERECIREAIRFAEENGYRNLETWIKTRTKLKEGDCVYLSHMEKSAVFFQIGERPLEEGMYIVGSHVDSPRMDIKQIPCYEEAEQVYLDTHYYGGVKKYQWLSLPLALHGVVIRKDGSRTEIRIGEQEKEPVFVIADLLPHLGREKNEQKVKDFIVAEKMDVLIGNQPLPEENGTENVKKHILRILYDRYQIQEEDLLSAELEIVPAGRARECGLDRSMILAYGQDDRSCAFASLKALIDSGIPGRTKTGCCLLVDKEETGSNGATGMKSRFFENTVAELLVLLEKKQSGVPFEVRLRRSLANSKMLSADVSAAFDPMYETYFEKKNSAYLANGLVFNKYSGSGGKTGANDANPEFMAQLRRIMEEQDVVYQTAELGGVDQGGGGTIAYIMARYGMEVIDCGIAVLGMHAPWEVTSKADLYEAVKGYTAFYRWGQ